MIATMLVISLAVTSTAFTYREIHPAALFPFFRAAIESDIARPFVNPAYLPESPSLFVDMSYARPYNLEGLSASSVCAGTSLKDIGGQLSWHSFGIDEYKEDIFETSFGCKMGNYLSLGIAPNISKLSINTGLATFNDYFFNLHAGLVISPFKWIALGYHQENIRTLFLEEGRDIHYPGWSAGAVLKPATGFSVSYNLNKTYFSYVNTFAASANLLKWLSVAGGYSRETSSFAGACTIIVNGIMASYGLRYHSYLGTTHSFSVTLRYGALPLEEIRYSKPRKPPCDGAINAKTCSVEDLTHAGIAPLVAERIIKYRETIGPLNKKSLIQMGLSSKEYRRLSPCFLNLADDDAALKKDYKNKHVSLKKKATTTQKLDFPYRNADARKLLFQKLIQEGVKASSALRITELAKDISQQKLLESINHLSFLNDSEKQAAKKVCAAR